MAPREHGKVSGEERKGLKVLVTGASGFIGSHLLPALADNGFEAIAASRQNSFLSEKIEWRAAPELAPDADWSPTLQEVDAVVHLAGRAQIGKETAAEEKLCRRVNAEGTRALARQAAQCGVKHFVFLSSCHAVAAASEDPLNAATPSRPSSAYGRSKLAAEQAVQQELAGSKCQWTILRPPPVYGPGRASNFGQLAKLLTFAIPLPLASVRNRRSFIFVENLTDLISACLGNVKAFGKVFLPSDGDDISAPELIRKIAEANAENADGTHPQAFLFPFPEKLLQVASRLPALAPLRKLTSSLYVENGPLKRELGWSPPFSLNEGLRRTLTDYDLMRCVVDPLCCGV